MSVDPSMMGGGSMPGMPPAPQGGGTPPMGGATPMPLPPLPMKKRRKGGKHKLSRRKPRTLRKKG